MNGIWIGVAAATLCLAGEAGAQEPASASSEPARLAAGLAVLSEDRGYRGEVNRTRLVPALHLRAARFELVGDRATLRLAGDGAWSFGMLVHHLRDGFSSDDAASLAGMSARRSSWMVGVTTEWRGSWGVVRTDVERSASASRGTLARLGYQRPVTWGRFTLTPEVGVDRFSGAYVDAFYGVDAAEATEGRPIYRPGGSSDFHGSLGVHYLAGPQWALVGELLHRHFGADIRRSPLVDRRGASQISMGVMRQF